MTRRADLEQALAEWRFYAHTQRAEVVRLTADALYWQRMAELHALASDVAQRLLADASTKEKENV